MAAYRLILEDSCILSVLKGKISFQLTHMFGLLCPRVSYELHIQVHTDVACFCMRATISKKGSCMKRQSFSERKTKSKS